MAETEGSDDTSDELLNKSLSVWSAKSALGKEKLESIPLDLHTASSLGQYECVKNYIKRSEVDLNKKNKGGWTAVMYACYIGHDSIVNLLLEADISVNIRNHKGETPLMLASSCGNERVGFLLCSHNAELEVKDERGWTALFHATYSGHQNMVRFLLEQGANINAVEQSVGMTPFMEAAAEGHEIILQLFLQHGVNVNAKAFNGDTARSLALINGNMKIVSLIDNHVMPITSLRSEPGLESSLSSSDDAFSKARPQNRGRMKTAGGGPSIMDGPQAIARLIDRTRDNAPPKQEDGLVPKGYVTFPDEDLTSQASKKLSYRDVTSPINPDDYKLDSSDSRDSFDNEDDTNAFSKTGALTIKSSSGSSGGLAAALGIRREDSLDSDEFPHESSYEDSHPHGNSGDSSSEDGLDEAGLSSQIVETLKVKSADDKTEDRPNQKSVKRKKSKDKLTAENVNEIEVMKNSVSEWIDSVQDTHPIPVDNIESQDSSETKTDPGQEGMCEKISAIKPEYEHVRRDTHKQSEQYKHPSKSFDIGDTGPQTADKNTSSQTITCTNKNNTQTASHMSEPHNYMSEPHDHMSEPHNHMSEPQKHMTEPQHHIIPEPQHHIPEPHNHMSESQNHMSEPHNHMSEPHNHMPASDFFDQVAKKVQVLEQEQEKQQILSGVGETISADDTQGKPVQHEPSVPPVSALNLLNTMPDTDTTVPDTHNISHEQLPPPTTNPATSYPNPTGYHGTHAAMAMPVSSGYPPGFGAYQMFPQGVPTNYNPQPPVTGVYDNSIRPPVGRDNDTDSGIDSVQVETKPSSNAVFMEKMGDAQPSDLATLLEQLGLSKYLPTFEEQDVDLQVFLSLTDNDLKEVGIKLFGPRKKMTNAIARWQGKAKIAIGELEQVFADRLSGELQEIGGQLYLACEQVEKLKAQVKQEQQLRNVTETCLMEERAAWQHVQRIIMDTRQQCEDFKDVVKKLMQYVNELKTRVPLEAASSQQKRPIHGQNTMRDEYSNKAKSMVSNDQLPTDSVVRKVDYYMQEIQHLLVEVTGNTDRLLGRNA